MWHAADLDNHRPAKLLIGRQGEKAAVVAAMPKTSRAHRGLTGRSRGGSPSAQPTACVDLPIGRRARDARGLMRPGARSKQE